LLEFGLLVPLLEEIPLAEFLLELLFLATIVELFWPDATALLLDLWEPTDYLF
jgi:hypothetical protein